MSDLHAHSVPYVRDTMLPPVDPPASETGAIGWLRENLFSGAMNTVLTILSVAAIVWLIQAIFPWFANSVWHADSLDHCREILDGATGACFAVITERFWQLMYGFYPTELYWRANLTLLLFFVALVPILFINVSSRGRAVVAGIVFVLSALMVWGGYWSQIGTVGAILLAVMFAAFSFAIYEYDKTHKFLVVFSALFPFLMVWLIWGGSVWGPISVLATAAVGYVVWTLLSSSMPKPVTWIVAAVGAIGLGIAIYFVFGFINLFMRDMGLSMLSFGYDGPTPFSGSIWAAAGWFLRGLSLFIGALVYVFGWVAFAATYLGPIAGPVLLFMGVIRYNELARAVVTGVYVIGYLLLGAGIVSAFLHDLIPYVIQAVESRQIGGFMVALIIGISGIALSLPLGVLLALGRQSNLFFVHTLSVMFIEFIRGVPLITLLFTASLIMNYFLPPGTNFDILLRVIILVTLFAAAYNAETIRGGLAALPRGQYEAADSLGLDYWKAQRLIIMPQALKISIPGIVNNFIGLFKDTTLVTFIGILDILNFTNAIRANAEWHGIYWELYLFVGFVFFISCFPMGRYSKWLEGKLATDHR